MKIINITMSGNKSGNPNFFSTPAIAPTVENGEPVTLNCIPLKFYKSVVFFSTLLLIPNHWHAHIKSVIALVFKTY